MVSTAHCGADWDCTVGYKCSRSHDGSTDNPDERMCCFIGFGHKGLHCNVLDWQSYVLAIFLPGVCIRVSLLGFEASHLLYVDKKCKLQKKLKSMIKSILVLVAISCGTQAVQLMIASLTSVGVMSQRAFESCYSYINCVCFVVMLMPAVLVITVWIDAANDKSSGKGRSSKMQLERSKQLIIFTTAFYFAVTLYFGALKMIRPKLLTDIIALVLFVHLVAIGSVMLMKKLKHSEQSKAIGVLVGGAASTFGTAACMIIVGESLRLFMFTRARDTTTMFIFGWMLSAYYSVSLTRGVFDYASGNAAYAKEYVTICDSIMSFGKGKFGFLKRIIPKSWTYSVTTLGCQVLPTASDEDVESDVTGVRGSGGGGGGTASLELPAERSKKNRSSVGTSDDAPGQTPGPSPMAAEDVESKLSAAFFSTGGFVIAAEADRPTVTHGTHVQ